MIKPGWYYMFDDGRNVEVEHVGEHAPYCRVQFMNGPHATKSDALRHAIDEQGRAIDQLRAARRRARGKLARAVAAER